MGGQHDQDLNSGSLNLELSSLVIELFHYPKNLSGFLIS